jgi:hypothetical protein
MSIALIGDPVANLRGVYSIKISMDFKRFFYDDKIMWYSIRILKDFKKV